jgi:hypothetical protein
VSVAPAEPPEAPPEAHAAGVTIVKSATVLPPSKQRHRPPPVSWNNMAKRKNTAAALESAELVRGRGRSQAELEEQPWKVRRCAGTRLAWHAHLLQLARRACLL